MTVFEYSAGAFVYRYQRGRVLFLLLKKSNGEYDLPKGHIEKGEHAEDAARREIMEETGIDAQFDPFFSESTRYFFFKGSTRIAKQVKFFLCRTESKEVRISLEHLDHEWCDYHSALKKLKFKDLVSILPRVMEYIRRKSEIEDINSEYAMLPKESDGWDLSRRFVPGEGRLDAMIMLVGQAPGAKEDEQLRPFVGRSGILLDSVLRRAGIRRRDTYITSVVQFFPPGNRMPSSEEVKLCRPFLQRQIEMIKPRYIVAMGNLAAATVAGVGQVEKNHGKIIKHHDIYCLITFHPAAALRFRENYALMLKDFKKIAKRQLEE
jgi:DNA polymerase